MQIKPNLKKIKLMAEYGCWPLWWNMTEMVGNIDPRSLPLSQKLIEKLDKWEEDHNSTYSTLDTDYPPNSSFQTPEAGEIWKKEGLEIWQELQNELEGEYEVSCLLL